MGERDEAMGEAVLEREMRDGEGAYERGNCEGIALARVWP
jgi:hypothetical protein